MKVAADTLLAMIVQVYTARGVAEARAMADLGVDHIGVTISARGLPGEVDDLEGKAILAALKESSSKSVALTVDTDLGDIQAFAKQAHPDILHLCGDIDLVGPDQVSQLAEWLDGEGLAIELMQAIPVIGPESVDLAVRFTPHVDWLILDSLTDQVEGIGAAGVTHDWTLSRRIVAEVDTPVILAGGLGPDNVAEAIAAVGPAGVDSLTRTNRSNPDGTFVKDLDAVSRFVAEARRPGRGSSSS